MSLADWVNVLLLCALLVITIFGMIVVERRPRLATNLLVPAAAYGALMIINVVRVLISQERGQYSGPSRALSLPRSEHGHCDAGRFSTRLASTRRELDACNLELATYPLLSNGFFRLAPT